ncbi:MAG: alpha/beta hydrolase-fold protein [Bacteroidota bacterium]
MRQAPQVEVQQLFHFHSNALKREVRLDVYLPADYFSQPTTSYPVLLLNDGQDLERMQFSNILQQLWERQQIPPIIAIGIYAGDRMHEYGTSNRLDYKGRGSKAKGYSTFIRKELLPFLRKRYRCTPHAAETAVAGFSLGGLSAFDLAWHHPDVFQKVGVFSGSFWWRYKAFNAADPDAHRVVHDLLKRSKKRAGLQFWLQTGTNDEQEDRNNNGVIDAIDDTLDLIKALEKLGYQNGRDIKYVEVMHGEHNPDTWGMIMPEFLKWGFGGR